MDNISHSVVSLVAGELLHRSIPSEDTLDRQNLRQKLILFTACVSGNFPDLDLVLYPLLKEPLGYLLHHRGHSHTFLWEIPQALLLFALIWICWPQVRELLKTSRAARVGYIAATVIGFVLHISMDYLNSYGVHPFHPFDSHWVYGDLVFIVEPLFWIAFGVPVAFLTRRAWLRYPFLLLIFGVPLYASYLGLIPKIAVAVLAGIAAGLGILQNRDDQRGRQKGRTALIASFALSFAFILTQVFALRSAREDMRAALLAANQKAEILDVALTAYPSNPFCWSFAAIEKDKGAGTYQLRSGLLSLAPRWLEPSKCPTLNGVLENPTVLSPQVLQGASSTEQIQKIVELSASNCHLNAWLRFARIPHVTDTEAADLRYSRTSQTNFTTLRLSDFTDESCAHYLPPWTPPREDLLRIE